MMIGFLAAWEQIAEPPTSTAIGLTTYAGLAALATMIIGAAKKMFAGWMKGKENLFAMAIPVVIGVLVKIIGIAFGDIAWTDHVVALIAAGVGSTLIHDKIVNPVIASKPTPAGKPPAAPAG